MTNYEKLVEKLKEVEDIKNDLEKLKFGAKILNNHTKEIEFFLKQEIDFILVFNGIGNWSVLNTNFTIIGNPLEERHLRMYCEKKDYFMWVHSNGEWLISGHYIKNILFKLDNTKPFHLQEDKVYGNILYYLNNI